MAARRREGIRNALALAAGAALAAAALAELTPDRDTNFGDFALGRHTTPHYARKGPHPIHCRGIADAAECLRGNAARGGSPVALWMGNSQLHGINQMRPGDGTAPPELAKQLGDLGLDVLAFSQPNANPQEQLVQMIYLAERLDIEWLVVPLVFDDYRESGIRAAIATGLADPEVARSLERYDVGRTLLANHGEQIGGDLAALDDTVQRRSELALNEWLEARSSLWAARPRTRGQLFTKIYLLRNSMFGISAQSKRRVIPGRLALNLAATRATFGEAKRRGIRTLAYVVPLRNDVAPPYVGGEYARFKEAVRDLARDEGAVFADLEDLVPAQLWGSAIGIQVGSDEALDFMHFQGPGHRLLGRRIAELIRTEAAP